MVAVESDIVEGRKIRGGSFLYWPQMKAQKKKKKWRWFAAHQSGIFVLLNLCLYLFFFSMGNLLGSWRATHKITR